MESFVPFAGFFSSSTDYSGHVLSGSPYQYLTQCNICIDKNGERETIPMPKTGFTTSIADEYHCSLPSWLQMLASNVKVNMSIFFFRVSGTSSWVVKDLFFNLFWLGTMKT